MLSRFLIRTFMKRKVESFLNSLEQSIRTKTIVSDRLVLENYAMQVSIVDYYKPIIFTFDNMDTSKEQDIEERSGWGHNFLLSLGYNVCSFLEKDIYQWYRREEFHNLIEAIRNTGVFQYFSRKITYGSSMGGYAASAYASILNANLTVLINPISTLNKDKAGFETRFKRSKLADWNGAYHDGVLGVNNIKSYVVYDPLFDLDAKHAKRYLSSNRNMQEVRVFGFGHGLPWHLKSLGILKPLILSLLENSFDSYRSEFTSKLRARRLNPKYYRFMLSSNNVHLTTKRSYILLKTMMLELAKRYPKDADFYRELSYIYSELDDELAFMYIVRAKKARPKGKVIDKRYHMLRNKLKDAK